MRPASKAILMFAAAGALVMMPTVAGAVTPDATTGTVTVSDASHSETITASRQGVNDCHNFGSSYTGPKVVNNSNGNFVGVTTPCSGGTGTYRDTVIAHTTGTCNCVFYSYYFSS